MLSAGWPAAEKPDSTLRQMAAYIERMRERLSSAVAKQAQPKTQKKAGAQAPPIQVGVQRAPSDGSLRSSGPSTCQGRVQPGLSQPSVQMEFPPPPVPGLMARSRRL